MNNVEGKEQGEEQGEEFAIAAQLQICMGVSA
jgi:hypothetical protein